jgi:hypothetical protein
VLTDSRRDLILTNAYQMRAEIPLFFVISLRWSSGRDSVG